MLKWKTYDWFFNYVHVLRISSSIHVHIMMKEEMMLGCKEAQHLRAESVLLFIGLLEFPGPAALTQVTVTVYSVKGSRFTSRTDSVSELTLLLILSAESSIA